MQILEKHIDFIENSLKLYGVKSTALQEDLVDHICTYIENQESHDFNTLYQEALQKFGGYASFQNLQLETNFQKYAKELVMLNKLKFICGSASTLLLIICLVFKFMHWPYANALMISAFLVFALLILPIHFYTRYKNSIHKFS